MTITSARIARDSQLDALFADREWTVVNRIALPGTAVKFVTVVGSAGRNGYTLESNGETIIAGFQTVCDAADRGAINYRVGMDGKYSRKVLDMGLPVVTSVTGEVNATCDPFANVGEILTDVAREADEIMEANVLRVTELIAEAYAS